MHVRAAEREVVARRRQLGGSEHVPRLPVWGEEYEARSIHSSPGGKALNQAVALARLGAQVTAVGVMGDDGFGRDALAALAREGIDVGCVELRAKVATT